MEKRILASMLVCVLMLASVVTANTLAEITVTVFAYPEYGGTVTGTGIYNIGETVTLTAAPNPGWVFSNWEDGHSELSTDATFVFTASPEWDNTFRTITAVFVRQTYAPSLWAESYVNAAIAAGLVPQALQSHYTQNINRAEFAQLAVMLYEHITIKEIAGREQFSDTNNIYVQKAAYINVVHGVADGRFAPERELTREQAALMLVRLFNAIHVYLDTDLPVMLDLPYLPILFLDYEQISPWAYNGVASAFGLGIMSSVGGNRFAPQDPYTREQSIATIMRLFEYLN